MTQSPRLWQLSEVIQDLEKALALILEDDSLSEEARESQLQAAFFHWLQTEESFQVKAEQVAGFIRHQEALVQARKAEAKRIRRLADQAEHLSQRLRRYLTNEMRRVGIDRVEGVRVKVGLRRKPARVLLQVSPEELPPEYVKVTYEPKLTDIKQLLTLNQEVDWASLAESHEYSVTIR